MSILPYSRDRGPLRPFRCLRRRAAPATTTLATAADPPDSPPSAARGGMRLWIRVRNGKKNVEHWYCGQSGAASEDNGDGGHRATLDVYYDPAFVTNLSQLGIKLLYWRTTRAIKCPPCSRKMIYLLGNTTFRQFEFLKCDGTVLLLLHQRLNNRTQGLSSRRECHGVRFWRQQLCRRTGNKSLFASGIFGEDGVPLYTWNAWRVYLPCDG